MNRHQLGEFEKIVMLTIGILYNEAYAVAIIDEIEKRLVSGEHGFGCKLLSAEFHRPFEL